eukprot:2731013-Rhodomonas_salina.3
MIANSRISALSGSEPDHDDSLFQSLSLSNTPSGGRGRKGDLGHHDAHSYQAAGQAQGRAPVCSPQLQVELCDSGCLLH